jgi:hypothetical protein
MFRPEDIGKGNRLYFKDDMTTYYSKNKDASNKFVFVTKDGTDQIFKKSISNIIQVDNKKLNEVARMQQLAGIITEIKVNQPIIKAKFRYGDEEDILVYKKGVNYEDHEDEINSSLTGYFEDPEEVTWSLISVPSWNYGKKYWWNDEEIDF